MKKYEGLFILNPPNKEEGLKDSIDKISAEIVSAGGKIETVQKMDKRAFSRVANKRHTAGFYVNIIFESEPAALPQLKTRFDLNEEVFRLVFTKAALAKPAAEAAA